MCYFYCHMPYDATFLEKRSLICITNLLEVSMTDILFFTHNAFIRLYDKILLRPNQHIYVTQKLSKLSQILRH